MEACCRVPELSDETVDCSIARLAVRGYALDPHSQCVQEQRDVQVQDEEGYRSDLPDSDEESEPPAEHEDGYPLIYPTADSCHFLIIQVRGYRLGFTLGMCYLACV